MLRSIGVIILASTVVCGCSSEGPDRNVAASAETPKVVAASPSRPERRVSEVAVEMDSWSAAKRAAPLAGPSSDLRGDERRRREVASMRERMDAVPMEVRRTAVALAGCRMSRAVGATVNGPEEITRAIADLKDDPVALDRCLKGGR